MSRVRRDPPPITGDKAFDSVLRRSQTVNTLFTSISTSESSTVRQAKSKATRRYQRIFPDGNHVAPEHSLENFQRVATANAMKRHPPLTFSAGIGYKYEPSSGVLTYDKYDRQPHKFAHELRHAYDHHHGHFDFSDPQQKSASEFFAFRAQERVAKNLGIKNDVELSPMKQAETYLVKKDKGYGGTPRGIRGHIQSVADRDDAQLRAKIGAKAWAGKARD